MDAGGLDLTDVQVHGVRSPDPDEAASIVAAYERRNRFIAPILRAVLSRFMGWQYDGTDTARQRLVRQLPLLALGPRHQEV